MGRLRLPSVWGAWEITKFQVWFMETIWKLIVEFIWRWSIFKIFTGFLHGLRQLVIIFRCPSFLTPSVAKRSRASLDKLQPLQPCRLCKTTLANMGNMLKLMTMLLMIQTMLSRCEHFVYCLADVRDVPPESHEHFPPVYSQRVEHHTVMVRKDTSWYFPFMCVVSTCFNLQFAWKLLGFHMSAFRLV